VFGPKPEHFFRQEDAPLIVGRQQLPPLYFLHGEESQFIRPLFEQVHFQGTLDPHEGVHVHWHCDRRVLQQRLEGGVEDGFSGCIDFESLEALSSEDQVDDEFGPVQHR